MSKFRLVFLQEYESKPHLLGALNISSPEKKRARVSTNVISPRCIAQSEKDATKQENYLLDDTISASEIKEEEANLTADLMDDEEFRFAWENKNWDTVERILLTRSRIRQPQLFRKENWEFQL